MITFEWLLVLEPWPKSVGGLVGEINGVTKGLQVGRRSLEWACNFGAKEPSRRPRVFAFPPTDSSYIEWGLGKGAIERPRSAVALSEIPRKWHIAIGLLYHSIIN